MKSLHKLLSSSVEDQKVSSASFHKYKLTCVTLQSLFPITAICQCVCSDRAGKKIKAWISVSYFFFEVFNTCIKKQSGNLEV